MRLAHLVLLFLLFVHPVFAQDTILIQYIRQGLENNLALKQKEFSLEKSILELREARGKFLPSIGIEARYSRAGGGRIIEFPVGDLMNPVYDAINLTRIQTGQTALPFPELNNEIIPFLRKEEHDTKVRAVQTVFQPALYFNQKIKADLKNASMQDMQVYKRELILEMKRGYMNYLKMVKIVELYEKTRGLLNENLRVSRKLVENGLATREVEYRAKAELSRIDQDLEEARKNQSLAQSCFNHLLNRPLDTVIECTTNPFQNAEPGLDIESLTEAAIARREELKQLREYVEVATHSQGLAGSAYLPGVVVVADYGFQGEEYRFAQKDDYWMVSGVMQWNLFNGFQDDARRQQAEIEKQKLLALIKETERRIELQTREAWLNLEVSGKARITSEDRLAAARESYLIVSRKYEQRRAPHIEYLDAQNALTAAEVAEIISKYDHFIRLAEVERAAALWEF